MSKIAALQARLGGGAGIMMGLRPGGAPPVKKKPTTERRHSLDNKALNRPINKATKKRTAKKSLGIDDEDDSKDEFATSLVDDIDVTKAKSVPPPNTNSQSPPNSNDDNHSKSSGNIKKFNEKSKSSNATTTVSLTNGSVNRASKDFRGNLTSGRGRSGTLSKTCDIESNDMDTDKTITVRLYHDWMKYFEAEAFSDVVKGFKITNILDSAFGSEFKDTGIENGWQLVKIGKRNVSTKNYTVIRGDLEKNSKFGGKAGYTVTFLDCTSNSNKNDNKKTETTKPTAISTNTTKDTTKDTKDEKKENSLETATTPKVSPLNNNNSNSSSGSSNKSSKNKTSPTNKTIMKTTPSPASGSASGKPQFDRLTSLDSDRKRSSSAYGAAKSDDNKRSSTNRADRGSSLVSQVAAQLMEEDANDLKKTVKLLYAPNKYIDTSAAADGRKGFKVDTLCVNSFADELVKLGIKGNSDYKTASHFWTISGVGNDSMKQDLSKKNYIVIRNNLTNEHKKSNNNGFLVTFQATDKSMWVESGIVGSPPISPAVNSSNNDNNNKSDNKDSKDSKDNNSKSKFELDSHNNNKASNKKEDTPPKTEKKKSVASNVSSPALHKQPSSGSGGGSDNGSVELMNENLTEEWKEVRLKNAFDKYFNGERDDSIKTGMKGFMITTIVNTTFGKEFRNIGISNKWRIWKINDLDCTKLSHMVLRNKLNLANKEGGANGYILTFISPNVQLDDLKTFSNGNDDNNDNDSSSVASPLTKKPSLDTSNNNNNGLNRQKSKSPRSSKWGQSKSSTTKSKSPSNKGNNKSPRSSNSNNKTELNSINFDKKSPRSSNKGTKMVTVPSSPQDKNKGKSNSKNDNKKDDFESITDINELKKEMRKLKEENEKLKLENAQLRDALQSRKNSIPLSTTNSADVASIQVAKKLNT